MKYDVVIIGAGLGGLECAQLLSRAGRSVLLLERDAQAGGCIQSYRRRGMAYDTGFHYVGGLDEGQSLHGPFRKLGLDGLPWQRLDPEGFDRVTIGQRTFAFAQGFEEFAGTLAADFPAERKALQCYAALLRRAAGAPSGTPYRPGNDSLLPDETLGQGAYRYLTETFSDPLLVNVLSGTSLKMELRAASLPLFTFAHGNAAFIESSWRLKGDGGLIVRTLADNIRSNGGEIVCNAEVEELVEQDGCLVRAVCTNGEGYEGKVFVSSLHPALTCGLVHQSRRLKKVYRTRMAGLHNTGGMFTASLRIRPQALPYFNCNHYVYRRPDVWTFSRESGPVGGVLVSCRVPEDGSGYTRQVDLLTPMPEERYAAWAGTKTGRRGEDYRAMKRRMAEECIALAERAVSGLGESVEEYYTSTPLTYRDYLQAPGGSAYGVRKDFNAPLATWISPRTPIPNLFLTGQSLMLHGLQGVTMTALQTCAAIDGAGE